MVCELYLSKAVTKIIVLLGGEAPQLVIRHRWARAPVTLRGGGGEDVKVRGGRRSWKQGSMSASATEVCAATKGLSLTKLYSGSPELFFNQVFTFGLLCLSPHCPILGRILLSQLNQNPTPFISDHPPYLIRSLILHHPQGVSDHPGRPSARILLGQFSQNPPYP